MRTRPRRRPRGPERLAPGAAALRRCRCCCSCPTCDAAAPVLRAPSQGDHDVRTHPPERAAQGRRAALTLLQSPSNSAPVEERGRPPSRPLRSSSRSRSSRRSWRRRTSPGACPQNTHGLLCRCWPSGSTCCCCCCSCRCWPSGSTCCCCCCSKAHTNAIERSHRGQRCGSACSWAAVLVSLLWQQEQERIQ